MKILQIMKFPKDEFENAKKKAALNGFHNAQYMGYDRFCGMCDISWYIPKWNNWLTHLFDRFLKSANGNTFVFGQLKMIKIANQHDLIYYPFDGHLIFIAILRLFRIIKTPVLIMSSSSYTKNDVPKGKQRFFKSLEWFFYRHGIDKIVFQSPMTKQRACTIGCMPLSKCENVCWGADNEFYLEDFQSKSKAKYYVLIGQNERDFDTIIEAFRRMPDKELKILARKVDYKGMLPTNIELINNPWDENHWFRMREIYKNAKASVLPVKRFTDIQFGCTVLVDSIASATPVFMTYSENRFIDIEDKGIGKYIKLGDVEGWVNTINYYDENLSKLDEMSNNEKLLSLKYNYKNFSFDIFTIMTKLVK